MASDIFNVAPPAWYVEMAKPPDTKRYGQLIGTALAGGVNAATRGTNFFDEYQNARINNQDPTFGMMLQFRQRNMELQQQEVDLRARELDLRMKLAQDTFNLKAQQAQDLSDDQNLMMQFQVEHPTVESRQGATWPAFKTRQYQQLSNTIINSDSHSIQMQVAGKRVTSYNGYISDILKNGGVVPEGLVVGPNGPSDEQMLAAATAAALSKRDKEARDAAAKAALQTQKDAAATTRQTALEELRQKGKVDLEKIKNDARAMINGKNVTRMEFINRHLNQFSKEIGDETGHKAMDALNTLYDEAQAKYGSELNGISGGGSSTNTPPLRYKVVPR